VQNQFKIINMKNIILFLTIIACTTAVSQTASFSGYASVYKKVVGEAIGNDKGIMVDRPSSDIEYSDLQIVFDNESLITAVALTRLDGRIELISTTGKNRGQLTGAYSSIRGDISLNLDSFGEGVETTYMLSLVKNLKTIVTIFFE
jgi:hypothetical protein